MCHKKTTCELAVMTFLSKAISKVLGFALTLPCLLRSILTTIVAQRVLRSEELALFAISRQGKPLLSRCVPSFSVVWTIATRYSLTSPLITCTVSKRNQNYAAKVVFAKADMSMLNHFSKSFTGSQSKKGHSSRYPPLLSFFYGTLPPYLSSCFSVYTPSRTLRSISDGKKNLSCARWKLKGFSHRSFSVQTPLVWNNRLPHIRHSSFLSQFKTSL